MTNEELLSQLLKWQNPHFRYKMRTKKPFILYVKNPKFPRKILYVRYEDDGTVLSTGETNKEKAIKFALEHLDNHTKEGILKIRNTDEFHKYILDYYKEGSEHIEYCNLRNRKISEKQRPYYENMMKVVCKLTPDVKKFRQLNKSRLIQLQEEMLKQGKSAKTVRNYFVALERPFKELADKDIIEHNPFPDVPPVKMEIKKGWTGFEIPKFKHLLPILPTKLEDEKELLYSLLGFIAIMTGQREGEIARLSENSVVKSKIVKSEHEKVSEDSDDEIKVEKTETIYWLNVDGTKTKNAKRRIPITKLTAYATWCFVALKGRLHITLTNRILNQGTLLYYGKFAGKKSIEELKNKNNDEKDKIVFHGFRKMYKTLLTQENVNTDLIKYYFGHKSTMAATRNKFYNVEDTYLMAEKSDDATAHNVVTKALSYFEVEEPEKSRIIDFLQILTIALNNVDSIQESKMGDIYLACQKMSYEEQTEKYKKEYGDFYWGGQELTKEQKQKSKKLVQKIMNQKSI